MIRINEFVRGQSNNLSVEESFKLRQSYERLPKILKKKMSRDLTKFKQNLSFSQWWDYIGQRVKEGRLIHKKSLNNIRTSTKYDSLKEQVRDPQWRAYAGHREVEV